MLFEQISSTEAIKKLHDSTDAMVSLYLPYGVLGQSEDRFVIERKNAISQLEDKIQDENHVFFDCLTTIKDQDAKASTQGRPYTVAYFFNDKLAFRVMLSDQLRTHFSLASYPEIEPLIYANWAYEDSIVCKIDQDGLKVYQCRGTSYEERQLKIPVSLKNSIGERIDDFSFDNVIRIADLDNDAGADLGSGPQQNLHGLSSRQISYTDKKRNYWLKIMGEIFRTNVDEDPKNVFIHGPSATVQAFHDIVGKSKIPRENLLESKFDSTQEVVEHVMKLMLDRKMAAVNQRFDEQQLDKNVYDIVDLIKSGQTRELFVEQLDWFSDNNRQHDNYEFQNPRSAIIGRAIKYNTKINYTNRNINNRHRLCALAY